MLNVSYVNRIIKAKQSSCTRCYYTRRIPVSDNNKLLIITWAGFVDCLKLKVAKLIKKKKIIFIRIFLIERLHIAMSVLMSFIYMPVIPVVVVIHHSAVHNQ